MYKTEFLPTSLKMSIFSLIIVSPKYTSKILWSGSLKYYSVNSRIRVYCPGLGIGSL